MNSAGESISPRYRKLLSQTFSASQRLTTTHHDMLFFDFQPSTNISRSFYTLPSKLTMRHDFFLTKMYFQRHLKFISFARLDTFTSRRFNDTSTFMLSLYPPYIQKNLRHNVLWNFAHHPRDKYDFSLSLIMGPCTTIAAIYGTCTIIGLDSDAERRY